MSSADVILRRLDALADGIRVRAPHGDLQFLFDNARSAIERQLGTRDRPYDGWKAAIPGVELLEQAAAETDTFSFTIENLRPNEKERTVTAEALDATGDQIKAWVAARILQQWEAAGLAPKFISIDVKVGLE